ncbi:MAG: GldG family protein [Candidatus Krumholzibacteriia bacterium]
MARKRMNFRVTFGIAATLLLAIAIFLTLVLGNLPGARIDLTDDHLYTMSPASAKILSGLKVPVQVKLYITPIAKMPTELKTLERDIANKLRDYQRASNGMLQFAVFDPQDNEELQNQLAQKGLRPFQVQSVERDEIGVKLIWSAMTIAYKDKPEEVIPQVLPQSLATLEYELVSRVYRLTTDKRAKVALFAPSQQVDQQTMMMYLQAGMQPPEPRDVYQGVKQLLGEEHYEVQDVQLGPDSRIQDDASVLLVLNPTNLDARQAFEINRALSNGMNVILALQAHDYDYTPGARGGFTISANARRSGLDDMLKAFGLGIVPDHFFDSSLQVLSVPRTQNVGGLRFQTNEPVRAPMQILVTQPQMNSSTSLTNRIGSLLYLWGTPVTLNSADLQRLRLQATPLFTSSDKCWSEKFTDGVVPGSAFNANNRQFEGPQPLAVLVSGTFPDAFAGRPVPAWPADPKAPAGASDAVTPLTPRPAQLILVGDAKMFDDSVLQAVDNATFLLNSVDALAHGADLISIRSKALTQRTIKPVSDSEKVGWRLFVVGLVPIGLAIFGISRAAARRREASRYREAFERRAAAPREEGR